MGLLLISLVFAGTLFHSDGLKCYDGMKFTNRQATKLTVTEDCEAMQGTCVRLDFEALGQKGTYYACVPNFEEGKCDRILNIIRNNMPAMIAGSVKNIVCCDTDLCNAPETPGPREKPVKNDLKCAVGVKGAGVVSKKCPTHTPHVCTTMEMTLSSLGLGSTTSYACLPATNVAQCKQMMEIAAANMQDVAISKLECCDTDNCNQPENEELTEGVKGSKSLKCVDNTKEPTSVPQRDTLCYDPDVPEESRTPSVCAKYSMEGMGPIRMCVPAESTAICEAGLKQVAIASDYECCATDNCNE